jgi:hypothetical protein
MIEHTWKFFSDQPFLAKARTNTSASIVVILPLTHVAISSSAASRVFQFASPKSVMIADGSCSAASASASSGVCLNLTASKPPGVEAEFPLLGFAPVVAAAGGFLELDATTVDAGGFFD